MQWQCHTTSIKFGFNYIKWLSFTDVKCPFVWFSGEPPLLGAKLVILCWSFQNIFSFSAVITTWKSDVNKPDPRALEKNRRLVQQNNSMWFYTQVEDFVTLHPSSNSWTQSLKLDFLRLYFIFSQVMVASSPRQHSSSFWTKHLFLRKDCQETPSKFPWDPLRC